MMSIYRFLTILALTSLSFFSYAHPTDSLGEPMAPKQAEVLELMLSSKTYDYSPKETAIRNEILTLQDKLFSQGLVPQKATRIDVRRVNQKEPESTPFVKAFDIQFPGVPLQKATEEHWINLSALDNALHCAVVITVDDKGHSQLTSKWWSRQNTPKLNMSEDTHALVRQFVALHELAHCQIFNLPELVDTTYLQNQELFKKTLTLKIVDREDELGALYKEIHAETIALAWMNTLYPNNKEWGIAKQYIQEYRRMREKAGMGITHRLSSVHELCKQNDVCNTLKSSEDVTKLVALATKVYHDLTYVTYYKDTTADNPLVCQKVALYLINQRQKSPTTLMDYGSLDLPGSNKMTKLVSQNAVYGRVLDMIATLPVQPYRNDDDVKLRIDTLTRVTELLCSDMR